MNSGHKKCRETWLIAQKKTYCMLLLMNKGSIEVKFNFADYFKKLGCEYTIVGARRRGFIKYSP